MKWLSLLLRLLVLVSIATLLFFILVPDSFESTKYLHGEFIKSRESKPNNENAVAANPCLEKHINRPTDNPIAETTSSASKNPTENTTPKVLINRDPEVFDIVCQGDKLRYNLYAENVDRILVTYENEAEDTFSMQTIDPVPFKNGLEFEVPTTWLGPTSISATGFVKGKARLASSKVTFTVLNSETGLPSAKPKTTPTAIKTKMAPNAVSKISLFDGQITQAIYQARIIDGKTIQFGRIRLKLSELEPESSISLAASNAKAYVTYLTPAKTEAQAELEQLTGTISFGQRKKDRIQIKFDFNASNKSLSPEQDANDAIHTYRVFGETSAKFFNPEN